jgi:hypothetical protein
MQQDIFALFIFLFSNEIYCCEFWKTTFVRCELGYPVVNVLVTNKISQVS